MPYQKLFIIGNGFDLECGLKTRYKNFYDYMGQYTKPPDDFGPEEIDFFTFISRMPDLSEEDWCNFEEALGCIDLSRVVDEYDDCLSRCTSELLSDFDDDSYNESDVEEEAKVAAEEQVVDALSASDERVMRKYFSEWISSIATNVNAAKIEQIRSDYEIGTPGTYYITFNYTNTLEQAFDIRESDVCHIHGIASNPDSIVVGHGEDGKCLRPDKDGNDIWLPKNIENKAARILENTRKYPENILVSHDGFSFLNQITKVSVFGFGFGKVDIPYLDQIFRSAKSAAWEIWPHNKETHERILKDFKQCLPRATIHSYKTA